jgi:predicted O-methyltransferase YrrM
MSSEIPDLVVAAQERGRAAGFEFSCDPEVGRLLAVLAAGVPENGRILEIGTGVGTGVAWLLTGLGPRTDVSVTTIENDPGRAGIAAAAGWPGFVDGRVGDAVELLADLGGFDLVFADARGGKHEGLDRTVAAVNPRGVLVVDDMVPYPHVTWDDEFSRRQEGVRQTLLTHERLVSVELPYGSGVILATAR